MLFPSSGKVQFKDKKIKLLTQNSKYFKEFKYYAPAVKTNKQGICQGNKIIIMN